MLTLLLGLFLTNFWLLRWQIGVLKLRKLKASLGKLCYFLLLHYINHSYALYSFPITLKLRLRISFFRFFCRYKHSSIRANAESSALFDAESFELFECNRLLHFLVGRQLRFFCRKLPAFCTFWSDSLVSNQNPLLIFLSIIPRSNNHVCSITTFYYSLATDFRLFWDDS